MNRDMISPPMVFLGPPGYAGNCWIVDCEGCRGLGRYRVKRLGVNTEKTCHTCNGLGVVAVPRKEVKV